MNSLCSELSTYLLCPLDTDGRHIDNDSAWLETSDRSILPKEYFVDIFSRGHHSNEDINPLRKFFFAITKLRSQCHKLTCALWSTRPNREISSFCENIFSHRNTHETKPDKSYAHIN